MLLTVSANDYQFLILTLMDLAHSLYRIYIEILKFSKFFYFSIFVLKKAIRNQHLDLSITYPSKAKSNDQIIPTGCPSRSIRNFVKFHFILSPNNPPFSCFRKSNSGAAFLPLTSILAYKSGSKWNFSATKFFTSNSHFGS